jgi:hypothetical protein
MVKKSQYETWLLNNETARAALDFDHGSPKYMYISYR